ncbi:MAG: fibronectin type III domain-containing protein [Desulfobacterales bacterium]
MPGTVLGQTTQLGLAWDRVTDGDVLGYRLYYKAAGSGAPYNGTGADQGPSPINVGNTNQYTLTGLDCSQDYEFTVTAYNASGESGFAVPVRVFAIVCATATNGQIDDGGTGWGVAGEAKTINISPNTGYMIADVRVDGNSVGPVFDYTFQSLEANHTISATFTEDTGGSGGSGDTDSDGDGLTDLDEQNVYGTNRFNPDTDGDGLDDGEEVSIHGTNPTLADTDGDGATDGEEINANTDPADSTEYPEEPQLVVESGEVQVDHRWHHVTFNSSFSNPVVLANIPSYNGSDCSVVRMRNITGNGFDIRIQEWDYLDQAHDPESVGYIVVEAGVHTLASGAKLVAGHFDTNRTTSFGTINFPESFGITPVVLTSVATFNGGNAVTLRNRNIGTNGFQYMLQEQESYPKSHATETISYIACEPTTETVGALSFEAGRTSNTFTDAPRWISFNQSYSQPPVLIAAMQTADGSDTAALRWQKKYRVSALIMVEEERSRDYEISHTTERVGYIAVGTR